MSEVRQPFCEKLVLERIDGVTNFQSDFYKRIAVGLGELGTSKSIPALDNLLSNVDAIHRREVTKLSRLRGQTDDHRRHRSDSKTRRTVAKQLIACLSIDEE